MAKTTLTTEEIISEIEILRKSPYVKLAKDTENRALRQRLYQLRSLEKRGKRIAALMGIDLEQAGDVSSSEGDK